MIINDSFISDIEDNNEKLRSNNYNNNNALQSDGIKSSINNSIYLILFVFGILLVLKFISKESMILILLSLIVYYLFLINNKLDKIIIKQK